MSSARKERRRWLSSPQWGTALISLLVLSVTCAVYYPVLRHDFTNYDDQDYVTENAQVQGGLTRQGVVWAFTTGHAGNWHPLTWASHMLDCQLFGLKAGGHHATSLAFHLANALLLFLLFKRLTGATWRSAFVALLFAVHPLHVESVAWVAERKDVLSTFFLMLTLWAWMGYAKSRVEGRESRDQAKLRVEGRESKAGEAGSKVEGGGSRGEGDTKAAEHCRTPRPCGGSWAAFFQRQGTWYILAVLFFALGLMSKPMLVTVPFVLLLLDYWPLRRLSTAWQGSRFPFLLVEKLPFFALAAASSVVTFIVQNHAGAVATVERIPLELRFENALCAYLLYLWKMVWPVRLAPCYPYVTSLSTGLVMLSAAVLLGVSFFALKLRQRLPFYFVGWFWFLGMLVPVIGLVQVGVQSMADRYSYIPLIGVFIAISWGAWEYATRFRACASLTILAIVVVLAFSLASAFQVRHWRNSEMLFRHTLAVTAENFIAHQSLGANLVEQGRLDEARGHFAEAVRIRPSYADAQSDYGLALAIQGNFDEAIEHYRTALALRPGLEKTHYNLGRALATKGLHSQAIAELQNALAVKADYLEAKQALAGELAGLAQYEQALPLYLDLLKTKPDDTNLHFDVANIYKLQGRQEQAITHFSEVIRLRPEDAEAHENLGVLFAEANRVQEGILHLAEAARLRPSAQVYYGLGLAFVMNGSRKEARENYLKAIQLREDFPLALNDLAWLLATAPEPELRDGKKAVQLAERACLLNKNQEARFLGTLDAAYAEAGRFSDAVKTAELARERALACRQGDVAEAAEKRLGFYRDKRPFRQ